MSNKQTHFTSDLHLFHKNILKFTRRPVKSVEEMHKVLVENWNSDVNPDDDVYILGDTSFGKVSETLEIIKELNGNLYFLQGNHCSDNLMNQLRKLPKCHAYSTPYLKRKFDKQHVIMCHYPIACWDKERYGSYMLYGHTHNTYENHGKSIDVGIDAAWENYGKFRPLTIDEIHEIMSDKTIRPLDGH